MSGSGVTTMGYSVSLLPESKTGFDVVQPFLESAPVNLEGMALELGIQVDLDADLGESSGRIMRTSRGYKIEVNRLHSARRKRFTLAHEIAHYLLHKDKIGDGITDDALYRSRLSSIIETEANRMAAQLLMPTALVRLLWKSGIRSLNQLCGILEVSEEALRIRLKQLRLDA